MEDHHVNDDKKIDRTINTRGSGVVDTADDSVLMKKNGNNGAAVVHLVEPVKEESELDAVLLPPPRKGGLARKEDKLRRTVQWNDKNGNELFEVMEYQPSNVSDSDDEDNDACICKIM